MALGIAAGASGPLGGPRALRPTVLAAPTTTAALNVSDRTSGTPVRWQNAVGVSVAQNSLTKTAAGGAFDAGASSVQTLWSGDGYVEFTTLENDKRKVAGLSNGDPGQTDTEIDFGMRLGNNGTVQVEESGVIVAQGLGAYVAGDVFRVAIESGVLVYRQNGTLLWVSSATPTYPLLADTSFFHLGGTITNARISAPPLYPVRWTEASGVEVRGNRIRQTIIQAGGSAGALSAQRLTSGDGYVEVLAPAFGNAFMFALTTVGEAHTFNRYEILDFALYHPPTVNATLRVYENGLDYAIGATIQPGDILRIGVEAGQVVYRQNGVLVYRSLTLPMYPLQVDCALFLQDTTFRARVSGMRVHTMHEWDADLGEWGWSPLTPDVRTDPPATFDLGIPGTGPLDFAAGTGRASWTMDNSTSNSEGTLGLYSPQHADHRDAWALGIGIRYSYRDDADAEPIEKFHGRLKYASAEPGRYGKRHVLCSAVDWMDEAASTKVNIPIQVGKRTDEVLTTVKDAVRRQPLGVAFDVADSTFPYVIGDGDSTAMTFIQRLCQSELGYCVMRRGVLTFYKRTSRLAPLPVATFAGTMRWLDAPVDAAKVKNRARVTVHPKRVDAAATTVLFAKPDESNPAIDVAQTITITGRYTDPAQLAARVGGMDMVTPAATTDYLMNAQEDGLGADLTANCAVVAVYGANQVEYSITNNDAVVGYLIKLQARGRGVYDYDPIDAIALDQASIDAVGEGIIALDMVYQSDLSIAGPVADYLVATWVAEGASEANVEYIPKTAAALSEAMGIEPGDAIVASESVTGVNNAFWVQHVSAEISGNGPGFTSFQWALQRTLVAAYWQVGIAGYSEVGITTVVGPL